MFEEVSYTLTEQELYAALRRTRRRAGPVRLAVQTVALAVLAVAFAADFVWQRQGGSLFLALALAVLAVGQWLFPAVAFRREARALAARATPVHLQVSEETIAAGSETVITSPLAECVFTAVSDELLLWVVDRTQSIAIPRRAVSEQTWKRLKMRVA